MPRPITPTAPLFAAIVARCWLGEAGQHDQPPAGRGVGHGLHRRLRRAHVLLAHDIEDGDRQPGQVPEVVERLQRLGAADIARGRGRADHRRGALARGPGARFGEPPHQRALDERLHPLRPDGRDAVVPALDEGRRAVGARVADHHPPHPGRMREREAQRRHAAERQADHVRPLRAHGVEHRDHVGDEHREGIGPLRPLAPPMAARVVADDAMGPGQQRDLVVPHGEVGRERVGEQQPGPALVPVDAGRQAGAGCGDVEPAHCAASCAPSAAITRGRTSSAISRMERRARAGSFQSWPA